MVTKVSMKKPTKPKARVYTRVPPGYELMDTARDLTQARALAKGYKNAVIVQTGSARGKDRDVFPYHIATRKGMY